MKLLIYSDDPGRGGTAVNTQNIALGLAASGTAVTVVISRGDEMAWRARQAMGIDTVWLDFDTVGMPRKSTLRRLEPLAILTEARPDIILFNDASPISSLGAKQAALQLGIPAVYLCNYATTDFLDQPECLALAKAVNRLAEEVVAVSSENLEILRRHYGLPADRGQVILNGIPDAFYAPTLPVSREAFRREQSIPAGAFVCFTAARYEGRKGYAYLIEAAARLFGVWPNAPVLFLCAGHPAGNQALLEEAIRSRGLVGRVVLLGLRQDISRWLAASDMFLLPSESEGMPLSIMEAMAVGVPVAASAVSGIPEQIGNAGILLPDPKRDPEGNIRAICGAVTELAASPARRKALAVLGRERAEGFRLSRMVREYTQLLQLTFAAQPRWRPRLPAASDVGYRPGERLGLEADSWLAMECLQDGWSASESWGTWTEGRESRLRIPLCRRLPGGFILEIHARGMVHVDAEPLRLEFRVAGRSWPLVLTDPSEFRTFSFFLADTSLTGADVLTLDIHTANPRSPRSLDPSQEDARLLGLGVAWLRLIYPGRVSGGPA